MNSGLSCLPDRIPAAIDVAFAGPCQPGNGYCPHLLCDASNRFEVSVGGDGKSRLDHIHPEPLQLMSQHQFLIDGHAGARRLFSISLRMRARMAGSLRRAIIFWSSPSCAQGGITAEKLLNAAGYA